MIDIGRRDFFSLLAAAGISSLSDIRAVAYRSPSARLLVTVIGDDDSRSALAQGVRMGIDEAGRSAAMFGGDIATRVLPEASLITRSDDRVQIVIDARGKGRERNDAVEMAATADALFMNVLDQTEAFRAECVRHVFHIRPSAAVAAAAGAGTGDDVVVWHPSLTRFGADTLNKRFRARANAPMDEQAWAGWYAIKCAWEAALHSSARQSSLLIAYLERDATRFDGHKGTPLYFNHQHELVQPLYIVRGGKVVRETMPPERASGIVPCA